MGTVKGPGLGSVQVSTVNGRCHEPCWLHCTAQCASEKGGCNPEPLGCQAWAEPQCEPHTMIMVLWRPQALTAAQPVCGLDY